MAQIEVTLEKGVSVGNEVFRNAVLRTPTAQDIIDAMLESEKLVTVPIEENGTVRFEAQLVTSPTATSINVLKKQIVSIGEFTAPIDDAIFSKLSPADLNILQIEAQKLEAASVEVAQRGRADRQGDDNENSHQSP